MINIPTYYVKQFSSTLQLLLQQKGSKLRPYVSTGSHFGDAASPVDQLGYAEAIQVTDRYAPMPRIDLPTDRRWVYPVDFAFPQLIDSNDKLRMMIDPNSSMMQSALFAIGRAMDNEILNRVFAINKTGVSGATSTSFLSGNVVNVAEGAASATGLTVAKLRAAKKLLMGHEVDVDSDPIYAFVKAKQLDNLLNEIQITSLDFNDRPTLVDGKVTRFLGINFVHCERIQSGTDDAAGTSDAIPIYAKSGLYLGVWNDIETAVDIRADLVNRPQQLYAKATFGATRLEEKKIVKVWCR